MPYRRRPTSLPSPAPSRSSPDSSATAGDGHQRTEHSRHHRLLLCLRRRRTLIVAQARAEPVAEAPSRSCRRRIEAVPLCGRRWQRLRTGEWQDDREGGPLAEPAPTVIRPPISSTSRVSRCSPSPLPATPLALAPRYMGRKMRSCPAARCPSRVADRHGGLSPSLSIFTDRAAIRAELDRVAEQVVEHAADPRRVPVAHDRLLLTADTEPMGFRHRPPRCSRIRSCATAIRSAGCSCSGTACPARSSVTSMNSETRLVSRVAPSMSPSSSTDSMSCPSPDRWRRASCA